MAVVNFADIAVGSPRDIVPINTRLNQLKSEINGSLSADNLADGAVTTAKIADDQVTMVKMVDEASTGIAAVNENNSADLTQGSTRYSTSSGSYTSKNGELLGISWYAQCISPAAGSGKFTCWLDKSVDGGSNWTRVTGTTNIIDANLQGVTYKHSGVALTKTTAGTSTIFRVGITATTGAILDTTLGIESVLAFM